MTELNQKVQGHPISSLFTQKKPSTNNPGLQFQGSVPAASKNTVTGCFVLFAWSYATYKTKPVKQR